MTNAFTILDGEDRFQVDARVDGGSVLIGADSLQATLGWQLEPEGLCRGGACVSVRDRSALERDGGIDLASLAAALGRPLALDVEEGVAALGTAADERRRQLESRQAPNFTLPDLQGKPHSLSDHLGKKVLLIAYASW